MPDETSTHAPYELTYAQPQPTTFVTRLLLVFGGLCRMLVIIGFCCLPIYAGHGGGDVSLLLFAALESLITPTYPFGWYHLVIEAMIGFVILECSNFFTGVIRLLLTFVGLGVLIYLAVALWRASDLKDRMLQNSVYFYVVAGILLVLSLIEAGYFRRQQMKMRERQPQAGPKSHPGIAVPTKPPAV